jgi:hypothetical protein
MPFIPNPLKSKATNLKNGLYDRRGSGRALAQSLGVPAGRSVVDLVVDHHLAPTINNYNYDQLFGFGDAVIGVEIQNVFDSWFRLAGLSVRLNLHNMAPGLAVAANVMPIATYGGLPGDPDDLLAAKWLVNASNTLGPPQINAIRATLVWINNNNYPLNTVAGLAAINHLVGIGGGVPPLRRGVATMGGPIVCSASGARLLEMALVQTGAVAPGVGGVTWGDYALYLLGVIVRAHGFTDGNGRTARAVYALAMLRGGVAFVAPTNIFEQTLHGL